jgi:uncharacterized Zn finger protein
VRRARPRGVDLGDSDSGPEDDAWSGDVPDPDHDEGGRVDEGKDLDDDDLGQVDEEGRWWPRRDRQAFGPAHLIEVEGGVAARTRRGAIGRTWWSRRFLASLEPLAEGGRLGRGKYYARKGQVMELALSAGMVAARVQGTRVEPYEVNVSIAVIDDDGWRAVLEHLAAEAGFAALLLAGEMPPEIEGVFARAGQDLFPGRSSDLRTACTCPDWANPCKHVAAVCYLVAEAFDDDPFLLLSLRGREREDVLTGLRRLRTGPVPDPVVALPAVEWPALADLAARFWDVGPELHDVHATVPRTGGPSALAARVRRGVIEVDGREIVDVLEAGYRMIGEAAARRAR